MIFWGEYHNTVNTLLVIIKIRLTMIRGSLPRAILRENKHLNWHRVRVLLNSNTNTKYHSVPVMSRGNMCNVEHSLLIPGNKHLQGAVNIKEVYNIKGI